MPVTSALQGLAPKEVALVESSVRFFVGLADSRVARRAVERAHYSKAQHAKGIALKARASGDAIPLPTDLAELVPATGSPWDQAIGRIDDFENTWVPLTETAAAMTCAGDALVIVTALFGGFKRAPRGPDVVSTTGAWLAGWDALEARKAEIDGAPALQAELRDTGLDDAKIAAVRADLAAIEAGGDMSPPSGPEAAREAALADQRAAFVAFRAWLKHWALRFRQTMPYADLVKMGLRKVTRKPAEATEEPAEDDIFGDETPVEPDPTVPR